MTGTSSGESDELRGVGPALKLRRLSMGLFGKQVAHDAELDLKWFEQRETGNRGLAAEPAGRWCAALGTTVGAMIDEVVGLHEVLPKALGRTLYVYVAPRGERQTVLEISPGPAGGPTLRTSPAPGRTWKR